MDGFKTLKCIVICLFLVNLAKASLIVETDLGKIEGEEVKSIIKNEKYFSFMGIPYGKAPVGPLRFKSPEPHEGWTDILNGKKEQPPCTQFNLPMRRIKEHGTFGKDDCLHLSIHTPKLPSIDEYLNLPVIVFLYNEHFRLSHNSSRDYGPDFFMKEDVILVTISHRLGASGFLAFEDNILPGNNGIKDVILGLKWLQRNIHKFGGDTFGITLMGVDGGATLVDILLQSPKAKGLFSRVIMHSDTSWHSLYFPKSPKRKAELLAKYLKISAVTSTNLLAMLSSISAEEIAVAEPGSVDADEGRATQRPTVQFGPVIEPIHPDAVISRLPEDGPLNIDIPVMIGYNSRESLQVLERLYQKPQYLTFADRDFLVILPIRDNFSFKLNTQTYWAAVQEIKDFYFDEGYIKISKPGEYVTYITDISYFYPVDYAVRKYVNESNSQVYYYSFDYSGELNLRKKKILEDAAIIEGSWGAAAGDELCYLFFCKSAKKTYQKLLEDEDSEEVKVINNMVKMWTNFAKSGNPTPEGSAFTWTPATKENKEVLVISEEPLMKNNLHSDRVQFWDDFLAKYKEMAVDGIVKDVKDEL